METITRALQRARKNALVPDLPEPHVANFVFERQAKAEQIELAHPRAPSGVTKLDEDLLRYNHIVAFDPHAGPTRHYDILRNQLSLNQRRAGPHIVAVSSPTLGCGATVTAINLALSFARTRARRVVLVDASGGEVGLRDNLGLLGLGWRAPERFNPAEASTQVEVGDVSMRILTIVPDSTENLISRRWFDHEAAVVVLDLPPMLTSDRAMPYVHLSDSVAVVLAEDQSTHAEVESCKSLLGRREGIQYVLNRGGSHGL